MNFSLRKLAVTTLLLAACGGVDEGPAGPVDGIDDCAICVDGRADRQGLSAYEAAGVLELVNTASRRELDDDAGLDVRAANNIVDERMAGGAFDDLERLDDVPYVGPHALERLLVYAELNDYVGACGDAALQESLETCDDGNTASGDGCSETCQVEGGTVHGVEEGSAQALAILEVANSATLDELDVDARLDRRAAQNIVDGRPFGSLHQLAGVPYVAETAFDSLLYYASTRRQCGEEEVDELIADVNGTRWSSSSTREIRTDMTLDEALDSANWPADLVHAGCFGVDADDVPSWVSVTEPEDDTRMLRLFEAFADAAERRGTSTNLDAALEELTCRTSTKTFVGCRLGFRPDPWSGINWNIIASEDGTISYLFLGTWAE